MIELTILMPCLNEAETVGTCVRKARSFLERCGIDGEVLVADNGSTDGSQELARQEGARVVHVAARGYGNALRTGIEAAQGTYVIMGDADDSYDFTKLEGFVERLRAGDDLVMGNRFAGGIEPGAMPALHRYLGNPVLSFVGRLFFRAPAGDFHCGLRGFRRDSVLALELRTTGMEFASELVVKASLHGLRISEVPVSLHPDGRSRPPHLRSWRDGWRHLRFLLLFSPRWLFLYPGLLLTAVGGALTALLVFGPITIGPVRLGVGALVAAAVCTVIGYQAVLFACLTKVFGQSAGFLPEDRRFNRLFRFVRLETGLLAGAVLVLFGAVAGAISYSRWRHNGWGTLETGTTIRTAVPAALCLVIGSQTILSSFFLSILGLIDHAVVESPDADQPVGGATTPTESAPLPSQSATIGT